MSVASRSGDEWESRRAWRMAQRAARASHEPLTGTWRTPLLYRLFFPAVGLYFLVATVLYFDGGADPGFSAGTSVLGAFFTVGPFVPVVRLRAETVYARGLVFHRTIPLIQVIDARAGYSGLTIETNDGRTFEATGIAENWNISRWLNRHTTSDHVADIILNAAAAAQRLGSPD